MSIAAATSTLFLFFAVIGIAQAEPAVDESRFPRQVQRIDGILVPNATEIFNTLDRFRNSQLHSVLQPDLATLRPNGDPPQIALSLGLVIGEAFVAVAAEDSAEVERLGKAAIKLARALGVEKSVLRRANSIVEHAHDKDWAAVRKEWTKVNADLRAAMIELGSEPLAQLVSLGGWLRGAEALSALVSLHYSTKQAQLLDQTVLLDYFEMRLSHMTHKIRANSAVTAMEKGIIQLRPLLGTEESKPISEQGVNEIHATVADMAKVIRTKTP